MAALTSIALPAQTAGGGDSTTVVGTFEQDDATGSGVTRLTITPPGGYTTVTGAATNNATISIRQVRAAVVVQTIGSVTLAVGTNLVAETPLTVAITNATALQPDDVVDVLMHQNASGLAIGAGLIVKVEVN